MAKAMRAAARRLPGEALETRHDQLRLSGIEPRHGVHSRIRACEGGRATNGRSGRTPQDGITSVSSLRHDPNEEGDRDAESLKGQHARKLRRLMCAAGRRESWSRWRGVTGELRYVNGEWCRLVHVGLPLLSACLDVAGRAQQVNDDRKQCPAYPQCTPITDSGLEMIFSPAGTGPHWHLVTSLPQARYLRLGRRCAATFGNSYPPNSDRAASCATPQLMTYYVP